METQFPYEIKRYREAQSEFIVEVLEDTSDTYNESYNVRILEPIDIGNPLMELPKGLELKLSKSKRSPSLAGWYLEDL